MAVSLAKPTDARETMLGAYSERSGLSPYFTRLQYMNVRRWAAKLDATKRASLHTHGLPRRAPMAAFALTEVMGELGEL